MESPHQHRWVAPKWYLDKVNEFGTKAYVACADCPAREWLTAAEMRWTKVDAI